MSLTLIEYRIVSCPLRLGREKQPARLESEQSEPNYTCQGQCSASAFAATFPPIDFVALVPQMRPTAL